MAVSCQELRAACMILDLSAPNVSLVGFGVLLVDRRYSGNLWRDWLIGIALCWVEIIRLLQYYFCIAASVFVIFLCASLVLGREGF